TPIHFTTSYVFRDSDHAASLFNMERSGHVYSRISNPTNAVLEERIAALEGGVAGIAVASGQAAMHLGLVTIAGAGSHVVASRALYGGSQNLLAYTMKRFGIDTTFVDPRDLDAWRNATRPNTKVLFGGTFDWQQAYDKPGRFAELCEPYDGFHGMVFAEESRVAPFSLRARREGLRDFGATMSPHNAFAILQGIETLGLRMDRHVANTRK